MQRLAIEIQDAKRLQLDDLTAQTRREMLSLEAKRREMENEMGKQVGLHVVVMWDGWMDR